MIDKLIVVTPSKFNTIVLKYICFYQNLNNNRILIIIYKYTKYKLLKYLIIIIYRFISFWVSRIFVFKKLTNEILT